MGVILGLLALAVFIVCVIGLAASVTWVVVRLSPAKQPARDDATAG